MMFSVGRLRTVSACVFVALLIAATAARSEPSFSLETTPGRLPKTIVPVHYALDLKPDLEKLSIAGTAVITVEVREPTEQLLLNAWNIEFASAAIDGIAASNISADAQAQTAKLTFAQ